MIKGIQIGKKYHISMFHFFMVSVLVFKIILMGLFSSDYQNLMFMRFVNGFLGQGYVGNWLNPYEYFYQEPGLFPYPPVMLAIECVGGALSLLAGKVLLLKNILFKLPNLVFDCLGMYYLMKLFPGKRKYIGVLYFASPIIIYSTYMHGQLDIIPTALFLGAISYLVSPKGHNGIKYILFLASSIACKFHILAAIPILFFFIGKRDGWKKAFLYTATPFALAFVCVLPFWGKGFLHNVLLNHEQAILTKITIDFSSVKIYIPVLAVILIYLHVFTIAKINRDLLYSFCGILFSIFLVLIPPMPGWYVWIIPFITIYFIDIRSDRYRNLVIYLFLNLSYLFYFVFAHHTSYVDLYYLDKSLDWIKADAPLARNGLFTVLEAVLSYSIYMMYQSGIASNSLYKRRNMPFTIGVSGDSGSGKSTFISMAEQVFGQKNLLFIEGDGDHKWERGNAMWKHFTHLNPKSNFLYRQARDLATLKSGQSVLRVDYDHSTGRFTKQSKIRPKPFILLCGLHALYLPQIRNSLDLKIYMDIDENLRRYWKIQRDVANRGYSKEKILEQISSRLPDAEKYIYPQRKHADLVVTYFDKHLKDCLVDGHTVKLSLKVTVNMELDLEDFIQIVENHGIHVEYDYNADLEKQSVIFESTNLEQSILPISSIAEQTVPHLDEIINHPLEGLDDLHGILAILLLMLIGEKMRGGGGKFCMLKAVIFDLDDTLYDYQSLNQSSINALSLFMQERLGIPENLFYEAFNWARKETKIRLGDTAASHNRLLYCQKTLEYLQAPPLGLALDMYECYWGHFLGNICLRDGAEELLRHCKTNHMKVGVCTDLTSHIQHRKIRKLGIANEINAFVSSEEVGAEKPAEIMYQAILKKLKATPKEAIFIGDDLEKDVVGPERAGMKAIWLHAEKSGPYQTCPSLKEVKGYLNGCR